MQWAKIDQDRREWVVVEQADGTLEDMGFVEWHEYMPLLQMGTPVASLDEARWRLAWNLPGATQGHAVIMGAEDYDGDDLRQPYSVDMADGSRELWHVGEKAYAKMCEAGLIRAPGWDGMVDIPMVDALCE